MVVTTEGNTVNNAAAFATAGSCLQVMRRIEAAGRAASSGFYLITVKHTGLGSAARFQHLRVWCDMESDGGGYTVYVQHC